MSCDASRKKYLGAVVGGSAVWRRVFGSDERAIKVLEYAYSSTKRWEELAREKDVRQFGSAYSMPRTTMVSDDALAASRLLHTDMSAQGFPSKHAPPEQLADDSFVRSMRHQLTIKQASDITASAKVWGLIQAGRTGDTETLREWKRMADTVLAQTTAVTGKNDRPASDMVLSNPHSHDGKWFHASPHRFRVGDIVSGRIGDHAGANQSDPAPVVYLTNSPVPHNTVGGYITQDKEHGNNWHVYEVEPLHKLKFGDDFGEAQVGAAQVVRYVGNAFGIMEQARVRASRRRKSPEGSSVKENQVRKSNKKRWG